MTDMWDCLVSPRKGEGVLRSEYEWSRRIAEADIVAFQKIGALFQASASELDGFSGVFNFSSGTKSYSLSVDEERVFAFPDDGVGTTEKIGPAKVPVFKSHPQRLLQVVAEENFGPVEITMLTPGALLAKKRFGSASIAILLALDSTWLHEPGRDRWLAPLVKDSDNLLILTTRVSPRPSWECLLPKVHQLPSSATNWRIARHVFCNPESFKKPEDVLLVFPEVEIFLDEIRHEISIFGRKIIFEGRTNGFLYLRGVCHLDNPMSKDAFAAEFLNHHQNYGQDQKVRNAQGDAKKMVDHAFRTEPELVEKAAKILFSNGRGLVQRNCEKEKVIFWAQNFARP